MVAMGKHHTAAVTRSGELYTWGSNRDGRLGYPAVDTQPIPRRYGFLTYKRGVMAKLDLSPGSSWDCLDFCERKLGALPAQHLLACRRGRAI